MAASISVDGDDGGGISARIGRPSHHCYGEAVARDGPAEPGRSVTVRLHRRHGRTLATARAVVVDRAHSAGPLRRLSCGSGPVVETAAAGQS